MEIKESPRGVAFNFNNASATAPSRNHSLPVAVISVHDIASNWLFARMNEVFAGVDDTLFATAEKVHTQEEQDGLFQALRVLRLERSRLTERFVSAVQRRFVDIDKPSGEAEFDTPTAADEGLSLVQNDDLEQQVALKTIVSDVKRDCASPIAELALRLDTLLPVKIYDENMPLSPGVLCRAFKGAIEPLDIHLRARLTLLKKFEQLLAMKLQSLYQNCNQLLIEKGVLPDLKDPLLHRRQISRSAVPAMPPGFNGGTTEGATPQAEMPAASVSPSPGYVQGAASFGGNFGVPNGATSSMPVAPAGAPGQAPLPGEGSTAGGAGGFGLLPPVPGVLPMATTDLLQHLSALQAVPLQTGPVGRVLDVNSLLQQRLAEARQSASLHELDTEVIRMVDLLFTFMLEDRNLAEPVKVQLIRLQMPLLKLAVADKSFFNKGGHPARKLLNALADAAIGWQPGESYEKEPFYREVCEVVERVLQEFDGDECVFARLLQSFGEFVARERRRAEVMERRTLDEAKGSARIEAAKARVAAVFDALTAERKLPRVVHEWLGRVWNGVLFRACLKEGMDSDSWRCNVLTARELVWSVVAPMPESRFKMRQLLPSLRKRLDEGAQSLSFSAGDRRRLMQGLDAFYRERQALGERLESERERRTRDRLVQELRREADSVMEVPQVPGVAEAEAELAADAGEVPAFVESPAAGEVEALEILDRETDLPAVEELQKVAEAATAIGAGRLELPADSDEFWRQTYHLKYSWFMLHRDDNSAVRCRLAAIIKDLDQFMFVNRAGAKVAVYTRLQLAHALRDQVITALDKGPLFERALKYVVDAIGESRISVTVAEGERNLSTAVRLAYRSTLP